MSDRQPFLPGIRAATGDDVEYVRRLAAEAFARFGDYERLLPSLMPLPWMRTVVATGADTAIGFAMYSLEDAAAGEIDLVAIAVDARWRSRGVGGALLRFVENEALALRDTGPASVRLTVAEDNTPARGLFERAGYVALAGVTGVYVGGQRSLGMRKRLR